MAKLTVFLILAIMAAFILIGNFTSIPILIGLEPLIHVYKYESSDNRFSMQEYPEKGTTFDTVIHQFESYKQQENKPDLVLYRKFKKNYFKFWKWREYALNRRWKLPYKE